MPKNDKIWTRGQLAEAREMWITGHSATYIAGQIGKSRSAVVAKMTRLGLARKNDPNRKAAKPNSPKLTKEPEAPEPAPPPFAPKRPIRLLQLRKHHCRAILGDVGPGGFALYCGDPKAEGSSWCAHHRGLYFQPPREKVPHGQAGERQQPVQS